MTDLPAALQARAPILTEVVDLPDLADPPYPADEPLAPATPTVAPAPSTRQVGDRPWDSQPPAFLHPKPPQAAWDGIPSEQLLEAVLADLVPPLQALVSSRLRDVLAPAVQEAVEEAIERLRQPLIDAVQAQLREQLEQSLRAHLQLPLVHAPGEGAAVDGTLATLGLRFP